MAWVTEDLDDLLGLPLTPGAVDVLEGRQFDPGDPLGCLHHPLAVMQSNRILSMMYL